MTFTSLDLKTSYVGEGKKILTDFLLPTLNESTHYDRITGYYSIESLLAISQGIESLYEKGGTMRLVIGAHSIPEDLITASVNTEVYEDDITYIRDSVRKGIESLTDLLEKKRIATLAWMIEDGLLSVKSASIEGTGIFHPKTLIFKDELGNEVAAVGSSNETRNGLGNNFEQLLVVKSWTSMEAVEDQKGFFDALWNDAMPGVKVSDITEETASMIRKALGNSYVNPNKREVVHSVLSKMSKMPANFFVSGDIPSLYMHQERAVIDALSRWPIRVMLADEVGLGKTFEAAAVLTYLVKYCGIKRVIILTPKSVLQQWQDELYTNFGLNTWLFDSSHKQYISPNGTIMNIGSANPIGKKSPDLILMSVQYARGSKSNGDIFSQEDSILPDLLIVDEAHSARVSTTLGGKKVKTQVYKMIESVSRKIPHLVLATATPMQKDADEYFDMLHLLGLPHAWDKVDKYDLSLKLISSSSMPDLSDAATAARLLHSTIAYMKPTFSLMSDQELDFINRFIKRYPDMDNYDKGTIAQIEWPLFKKIFIELHPARLLTVRNTRRSLEEVGYKFPNRNLQEINLYDSDAIEHFYTKVNNYLTTDCFKVEKSLYPERYFNVGLVRTSYQQRVASSLYSCKKSLSRRLDKISVLFDKLDNLSSVISDNVSNFDISKLLDDFEDDELLFSDDEASDEVSHKSIDPLDLQRSVNLEYAALSTLVLSANDLLETVGDKKIVESINLCTEKVSEGDSVLLFSRYTDTVEALIKQYNVIDSKNENVYAIYTGQKSLIVRNGIEEQCDKNKIKQELFNKNIKIVFCSDAASEGLNLQAARVLINVDVPWTPARLEQRIGRIARLGQLANEVDIYNVWYPHSIEAKMYHRIQTRLKETNIAIGEFPDVIAESIKNAVLTNNEEDNSLQELKDIRNSVQTKALAELWFKRENTITISDSIRQQLIELCNTYFPVDSENTEYHLCKYHMPDGKTVSLADTCGMSETINLKSLPWSYKDFDLYGISVVKVNDLETCFCDENKSVIPFEKIVNLLLKKDNDNKKAICNWPKTLPNTSNLDLAFSVDNKVEKQSPLWIEEDDKNES